MFDTTFLICGRVSQGLQVGGPFLHFQHVELWKQGKGYFSKSLGSIGSCDGLSFNFYVVECCVIFCICLCT